jgi:hypothetical protein
LWALVPFLMASLSTPLITQTSMPDITFLITLSTFLKASTYIYIKLYIVRGVIMTFPCIHIIHFDHIYPSITLSYPLYSSHFLFPFHLTFLSSENDSKVY